MEMDRINNLEDFRYSLARALYAAETAELLEELETLVS